MDLKSSLVTLITMLALFSTILEAKSVKTRLRHMPEISSETASEEYDGPAEGSLRHTSRRDSQTGRRRRGFARWNVPQDDYDRFSMWKPSAYSLNRPYLIPIYGPAGQIPIYFPPQPYSHNVGVPPDNPLNTFIGPPYLPPKQSTPKPVTTSTMKIVNKFADLDDDDEPRPVWGNANAVKTTAATKRPRPQQAAHGSQPIPTRPPRPKIETETPPLVHHGSGGKIPLNVVDESQETAAAIDNIFGGSEQFRPQPKPSFQVPAIRTTTVPPRITAVPIRTTTRKESSGPSNCVWAVVSCCSATSTKVAEACFEQRGCPGPFWDKSPCDSDYAKAAINTALQYYGQ